MGRLLLFPTSSGLGVALEVAAISFQDSNVGSLGFIRLLARLRVRHGMDVATEISGKGAWQADFSSVQIMRMASVTPGSRAGLAEPPFSSGIESPSPGARNRFFSKPCWRV